VQSLVRDLNHLYKTEPAMHQLDNQPGGFDWIDCTDAAQSIISFVRRGKSPDEVILAVFNFTPVPRMGYRVGVPGPGYWTEILNTDAGLYGGSNVGNAGGVYAEFSPKHNQPYSLLLNLPPLGAVYFKGRP
jgi:1,4-alpha-glucan branching enzyme